MLKLYVIPGSHPCVAVEAALKLKGLDYDRVDLLPGISPLHQLAVFGRRTVPGLKVDGSKVVGSVLIMRTLEGLQPEPPLYPAGSDFAELERWGDDVLQEDVRWISAYGLTQRPDGAQSFLEGSKAPALPAALAAPATRAVFAAELRLFARDREAGRRALGRLPEDLDRLDSLIADGTIGGDQPNALDFELGSSVRLLQCFEDLRETIDTRPCGELARRLFPSYPGSMPVGALPADWIPDLLARAPDAAAAR